MISSYYTIAERSQAIYREKGSKFIAFLFPFVYKDEVKELLRQIKDEHPKANHYCYAYRSAYDHTIFRAVDAGEPAYTAGKPILNALDSCNVRNVLAIVVRYFGGTLLGAQGLIHAYNTVTLEALRAAIIINKEILAYFILYIPLDQLHEIYDPLRKIKADIMHTEVSLFQAELKLSINVTAQESFTQLALSRNLDYKLLEVK